MHVQIARNRLAHLVSGCVLLSVTLGVCLGGATETTPAIPVAAPVTPVIPAPVPPTGHHIRYQDLLPGKNGKAGEPDNQGSLPPIVESGPELSLGECINVALERQPTIKAAQCSLAGAQQSYKALTDFGTVGTIISPDLEIRKQQAERGLAAASSELQKARNEVIQDTTRMYYSVVYARQQGVIAGDTVAQLSNLAQIIREILNSKLPFDQLAGLSTQKLRVVEMGVVTAKKLQVKAVQGRKQAMAALRQVMAVDEINYPFRVKDTQLPVMAQNIPITRDLVVEQALARRPELALAAAGVDVFRLEVYAQGKIPFKRMVPTFASGSDLHAREVPQAIRGKEYRPGAIIPEMPTQLVGTKCDRVNRAMSLSQRQDEVFASARSLITLEAENAFYEYEMANENLTLTKEQLTYARELHRLTLGRADSIKEKDQLVQSQITVAKVESDHVEAIFDYLLSLASLERITAGGIRPDFPGR